LATYLLVHGSWHGGWCWEKVIPLLEQAGHLVFAPDLPGHGQDKTPLKSITLASYVNCIARLLLTCREKVILVGHSMAGMVISQVAEYMPNKIQMLVYLTAFLPQHGESLFQMIDSQPPTKFSKMMKRVPEENAFYLSMRAVKSFAYHLCDNVWVERAKKRLCVEPLSPYDAPVFLSPEKFGSLPKTYIECTADRAILIEFQRKMSARTLCQTFTLGSDHSPFYSDPDALAHCLNRVSICFDSICAFTNS
jgi:pimeloyl-ACP methyl ester carboxylesterase